MGAVTGAGARPCILPAGRARAIEGSMGNPPPGPSWWQRLRHPWVIIPAVLALATGVWWFGFRSTGPPPRRVADAAARRRHEGSDEHHRLGRRHGRRGPDRRPELHRPRARSPPSNVKAGDTVTAGQVLATSTRPSSQPRRRAPSPPRQRQGEALRRPGGRRVRRRRSLPTRPASTPPTTRSRPRSRRSPARRSSRRSTARWRR